MLNAEKIRNMTDEELAALFHGFCENSERCYYCKLFSLSCPGVDASTVDWVNWLNDPVEGENNDST